MSVLKINNIQLQVLGEDTSGPRDRTRRRGVIPLKLKCTHIQIPT